VQVKLDETVTAGHVVASITQNATSGMGHSKNSSPGVEPTSKAEDIASSPSSATSAPGSAPQGLQQPAGVVRQPSISFPPRRTGDGKQISLMSAEEAQAALRELPGATTDAVGDSTQSTTGKGGQGVGESASPSQSSFKFRPRAVPAAPLPPRTPISDREIEAIMLGVAD
jgi:hypothetical protein